MNAGIEKARSLIEEAERLVVLTGAGISTDSGIPDFRGPQGVWTLNPKAERMSDIRYYRSDPEVRRLSWQSRLAHPAWTAAPNSGHRALVALEKRGKLRALITQNIDGLHQRAGNSPGLVIEVHGNLHKAICLSCGWRGAMQAVLDRVPERRRGSVVRDLRRHTQERHDLVRTVARARGNRTRDELRR